MLEPGFEFDGVVRLTRIGAAYLLFTVLLGFAALNTGNNAIYIGLTFMLAGLILSGAASRGGLAKLEVSIDLQGDIWAGQEVDTTIEVRNRSRIWNVRDVVVTADDLVEPLLLPLLYRRETKSLRATLRIARRGRLSARNGALYTRYPFGLFSKRRRITLSAETIVFPRLLNGPDTMKAVAVGVAGSVATNRAGYGTEVFAFREYVRGDSLRLVHWKKSASTGRWIMKQQELESTPVIRVALDPVLPAGRSDEEFERLISSATTFIHHQLDEQTDIELHLPHRILRASDRAGRRALFEALALVEPSFEAPTHLYDRGTVVFSLRREHETRIA